MLDAAVILLYAGAFLFFVFNDTATTEIYTYRHTLSIHAALPISRPAISWPASTGPISATASSRKTRTSEEHTSEPQSLMRSSYSVFSLNKKNWLSNAFAVIRDDSPQTIHSTYKTYEQ